MALPKAVKKVRNQPPTAGTLRKLLLHNNAAAHNTKVTKTFQSEQGIPVSDHQHYSPDFAPCNFWLSLIHKDRLNGHKSEHMQNLTKAVKSQLDTIPKDYKEGALNMLEALWVKGEYYKGM